MTEKFKVSEAVKNMLRDEVKMVTQAAIEKLVQEAEERKNEEKDDKTPDKKKDDKKIAKKKVEDEDEDDAIEESLKVQAHSMKTGKTEELKVANLMELNKIAKTGKYIEFSVEGGEDYEVQPNGELKVKK